MTSEQHRRAGLVDLSMGLRTHASPVMVGNAGPAVSSRRIVSRRVRAFSMVEVTIATVVIAAVVGLAVSVLADIGTARAISTYSDAVTVAMDELLDEVETQPYDTLARLDGAGSFRATDLDAARFPVCDDEPSKTCLDVLNTETPVTLLFASSADTVPGSRIPAWVDVDAILQLSQVTGDADDAQIRVRRRIIATDRRNFAATATSSVAVVAAGPAVAGRTDKSFLPPVHLYKAGVGSVGSAAFDEDGVAVITVDDALPPCDDIVDECRLALRGSGSFWLSPDGDLTLTAPDVLGGQGIIRLGDRQRVRHSLVIAETGQLAVTPQALASGGGEAVGLPAGTDICLTAQFDDGVSRRTESVCDSPSIAFTDYATGNVNVPRLPIPDGMSVSLYVDNPDAPCVVEPICTSGVWGVPRLVGDLTAALVDLDQVSEDLPLIGAFDATAASTDLRLVWTGPEALPAVGYPGEDSRYAERIRSLDMIQYLRLGDERGSIALDVEVGADDAATDRPDDEFATVASSAGITLGIPGSLGSSNSALALSGSSAPSVIIDARYDGVHGANRPLVREQWDHVSLYSADNGPSPVATHDLSFVGSYVFPDDDTRSNQLVRYTDGPSVDACPTRREWAVTANGSDRSLTFSYALRQLGGGGCPASTLGQVRSQANVWRPGVWQPIVVSVDRLDADSATVRFFVDGEVAGTATATGLDAGSAADRPEPQVVVGRGCECLIDEIALLARAATASDAATLALDRLATIDSGGPVWSYPRTGAAAATPAIDSGEDASRRHPFVETLAFVDDADGTDGWDCDPTAQLLCRSGNAAPRLVGEGPPYAHDVSGASASDRTYRFIARDAEGDDVSVDVTATDFASSNAYELSLDNGQTWSDVTVATIGAATGGDDVTWLFRRKSAAPAVLETITVQLDDGTTTTDVVLGFHGSPTVVYNVTPVAAAFTESQTFTDEQTVVAAVRLTGPTGSGISGETVTWSCTGGLCATPTSSSDADGIAELVLDLSTASAITSTVTATAGSITSPSFTVEIEATPQTLTIDAPTDVGNGVTLVPSGSPVGVEVGQGNSAAEFGVTVLDVVGDPVSNIVVGGQIQATRPLLTPTRISVAATDGAAACVTDAAGQCDLRLDVAASTRASGPYAGPPEPNPARYQLVATSGSATSDPTADAGRIWVVEAVTRVEIDTLVVGQGESRRLAAVALSGTGRPVRGVDVEFDWAATAPSPRPTIDQPVTGTTNADGQVLGVTIEAGAMLASDDYDIEASVNGTVIGTGTVRIEPVVASVVLEGTGDIDVARGATSLATFSLRDGDSAPLAGATVRVCATAPNRAPTGTSLRVPRTVTSGADGRIAIPVSASARALAVGGYEVFVLPASASDCSAVQPVTADVTVVRGLEPRSLRVEGTIQQGVDRQGAGQVSMAEFLARDGDDATLLRGQAELVVEIRDRDGRPAPQSWTVSPSADLIDTSGAVRVNEIRLTAAPARSTPGRFAFDVDDLGAVLARGEYFLAVEISDGTTTMDVVQPVRVVGTPNEVRIGSTVYERGANVTGPDPATLTATQGGGSAVAVVVTDLLGARLPNTLVTVAREASLTADDFTLGSISTTATPDSDGTAQILTGPSGVARLPLASGRDRAAGTIAGALEVTVEHLNRGNTNTDNDAIVVNLAIGQSLSRIAVADVTAGPGDIPTITVCAADLAGDSMGGVGLRVAPITIDVGGTDTVVTPSPRRIVTDASGCADATVEIPAGADLATYDDAIEAFTTGLVARADLVIQ